MPGCQCYRSIFYSIRAARTAFRFLHLTSARYEIAIKMPALSPTMTSGTIVKWYKTEGEAVAPGDVLCEIQTDKAVVAMETDEEGTLAKVVVPEGSAEINVGALIAVLAESSEDWKNVVVPEDVALRMPEADPTGVSERPSSESPVKIERMIAPEAERHRFSNALGPAVRLLLNLYQLKVDQLTPTGPFGTLLKGDVLNHITEHKLQPKPAAAPHEIPAAEHEPSPALAATEDVSGSFTDIPLTNMRKTIAKRLSESKQTIPHAYETASVEISSVLDLRKELKEDGHNITINDFIVKACATALQRVPEVNVQFLPGEVMRCHNSCDISVAVATESGLITPIVKNADVLGLVEISEQIKQNKNVATVQTLTAVHLCYDLADRAKSNKLQLHEFQGGSFTVSNLGMYGITEFTAIINPPQAAILAVGGGFTVLSGDLEPQKRMCVTLCFDNRAVGEDSAARFLEEFKLAMEDPVSMLLGGANAVALSAGLD